MANEEILNPCNNWKPYCEYCEDIILFAGESLGPRKLTGSKSKKENEKGN